MAWSPAALPIIKQDGSPESVTTTRQSSLELVGDKGIHLGHVLVGFNVNLTQAKGTSIEKKPHKIGLQASL